MSGIFPGLKNTTALSRTFWFFFLPLQINTLWFVSHRLWPLKYVFVPCICHKGNAGWGFYLWCLLQSHHEVHQAPPFQFTPSQSQTLFSAPSVALPIANNTLACPHLYFSNKAKEKLCSHRNSASGYDLLRFSTTLYAHHKSMAPLPCRAGPEEADCQNKSVFLGFEFSFVLQVSCLYATVRFCAWIFSGSCPPRHCQACCTCGCFYGFFPSNKLIHSRCWWASFSDRHRKENPSASPRVTVLVTSMPTDAHCRLPPVEDAEVVGEKVAQALLNTNWCCRIVETLNFCLIPFKTTRKRWIFICQVARKLHHNANGLGCRLLASAIRTKLHFIPTPK